MAELRSSLKSTEGDNRIALSSGSPYTMQVVSSQFGSNPVTDPGGKHVPAETMFLIFLPFLSDGETS